MKLSFENKRKINALNTQNFKTAQGILTISLEFNPNIGEWPDTSFQPEEKRENFGVDFHARFSYHNVGWPRDSVAEIQWVQRTWSYKT